MLTRVLSALVDVLRGHPRLAARMLVVPRFVPTRSLRAKLYRSFSWPLIDDLRSPIEVSSIGGRMDVDTGDVVGRVLAATGVWEPHVTEAFRQRLRPGDVLIDVGAHVGYYTLLGSKLVGTAGHVYAFEPSPGAYRALNANLALNTPTNVTALNVAPGAVEGSTILYEAPGSSVNSSISPRLLESPHAGKSEDYRGVECMSAPSTHSSRSTRSAACG